MSENSAYLRKLEQIEAARRKYEDSEWRLGFLRNIEPQAPTTPTDEQVLQWHLQKPLLN